MADSIVIAPVWNLDVTEDLGEGILLHDLFRLTNNQERIESLLTPDLREGLGINANSIQGNALAYIRYEEGHLCEQVPNFLEKFLMLVHQALQVLWVLQDNAVYVDYGMQRMDTGEGNAFLLLSSIDPRLSDSKGEMKRTSFTRSEIETCFDLRSRLDFHIGERMLGEDKGPINAVSYQSSGRIERMTHFLVYARGARDIGVKIVNYCTCLEILFSTDASEVTYKIAERVARFIESDADQRVQTFHAVKKAYSVRSRVVHGDKLSESDSTLLIATCEKLDYVVRRVFGRILSDAELLDQFEASKKGLDTFLLDLTLR